MRSEAEVQQLVQIAAPRYSTGLFRNNSGALKDAAGRLVRYGLGNTSELINKSIKSSDLIGIKSVTITPDMVGKTVGVFVSIEVKHEGWRETGAAREIAQRNWIEFIKSKGGIGGFVTSVDEFVDLIK